MCSINQFSVPEDIPQVKSGVPTAKDSWKLKNFLVPAAVQDYALAGDVKINEINPR